MRQRKHQILVMFLVTLLASSLVLSGCGSLARILNQPDPPRENTSQVELHNLLRTEETYEGIEVFHGTWGEPCYTEDEAGYFYEERGWIYLHVEGEPDQRGYQHGWLLADYIQCSIDHNKAVLAELYAIDWEFFKAHAELMWRGLINEELTAELEGIVEGAGERGASFDYLDLVVLNGLEELRDCWFPTVQESYYEELALGLWSPLVVAEPVDEADSSTASVDDEESDGNADTKPNETDDEAAETGGANGTTETGGSTEATGTAAAAENSEPAETAENIESTEAVESHENGDSPHSLTDPLSQGITGAAHEGLQQAAAIGNRFTRFNDIFTRQASALIATGSATEDGKILLAHNTIAAFVDSIFFNVMIDVQPTDGLRFTMQAAPGLIHSVSEVYSTEKLLIASTLIRDFKGYSEQGTPEFLRIREAAQYAESLDAFTETMLEGDNGGLASTWLVGELDTNEIMRLELGLSFYDEERITDGSFISFNGVEDSRILNFETDGTSSFDTRLGVGSRQVRLLGLMDLYDGQLTPAIVQDILSDHFDIFLRSAAASSRSICAHFDTDNAQVVAAGDVLPFMPYGTVDAKVLSSELAQSNTVMVRWGSACGRAFDSTGFLNRQPQYATLQGYLYDRPSQPWNRLYPFDAVE